MDLSANDLFDKCLQRQSVDFTIIRLTKVYDLRDILGLNNQLNDRDFCLENSYDWQKRLK